MSGTIDQGAMVPIVEFKYTFFLGSSVLLAESKITKPQTL